MRNDERRDNQGRLASDGQGERGEDVGDQLLGYDSIDQ
jgi:hypothetical protein